MSAQVRCTHEIPLPALTDDAPFTVAAERRDIYPVYVCRSEQCAVEHLVEELDGHRAAVVCDDTVATLHAKRLAGQLGERGVDVVMTSFPPGEGSKTVRTACDLLDWLAGTSIGRRDVLVAVGGGVVTDTVGWVASAYMRGIPYINVPTTLLGDVDAALGGKVAVDHPTAKNLIGAFYQPKAVVTNVGYLSTLDRRQLAAGLAEAIKKAMIASPEFFELLEDVADLALERELPVLDDVVRAASVIKSDLVSRDPYERDLRRPLNFGHTVGHAVETVTGYGPVLHGEAVAYGMTIAADIAVRRGLLAGSVRNRLVGLLHRVGLPTTLADFGVDVDPAAVIAGLDQIRKIRGGELRFVLPVQLGATVIADDVANAEIVTAMVGDRVRAGDVPAGIR